MTNLLGKTALVTGASRGIGRASALALGKAGARVLVHYGRPRARPTRWSIRSRATAAAHTPSPADLATAEGPQKLAFDVRYIVEDRLDVLVANAGVSKLALIEEMTIQDFDRLFAVNVRAPYFLVQQLLPSLGAGSSVVFLSSAAAHAAVDLGPTALPSRVRVARRSSTVS